VSASRVSRGDLDGPAIRLYSSMPRNIAVQTTSAGDVSDFGLPSAPPQSVDFGRAVK